MKFLLLLALLGFSTFATADSQYPISVKDRLRILLWTQGLEELDQPKKIIPKHAVLPEELERALRKN